MMRPGDPVLLRSIYRETVRWCWPHHYVGEWDGRTGLYCRPGNRGKLPKEVAGKGHLVAKPWPTGWEEWRPPAEWEPLALPEDWDVV